MATKSEKPRSACAYVVGDDGLSRWDGPSADAWIGLLETQRRLSRELEALLEQKHGIAPRELAALLEQKHGIGFTEFEVLARLGAADVRRLRVSSLAEATGLSVSRIS